MPVPSAAAPGTGHKAPHQAPSTKHQALASIDPHIIHLHLLRERRGAIRIAWPRAADGDVQDDEEVVVVHPARAAWKVRRLARRVEVIVHVEADLVRLPLDGVEV